MAVIDVSKLTKEQRIKLLEKAKEKLGMSKLEEITSRSRKQIYIYLRGFDERGKEIIIPGEVIEKITQALPIDQIYEVLHGFNPREVTINDAIAVITRAVQDPGFRNIFFMLLQNQFGEYLKETSTSYLVTSADIELFEKLIRNKKSKKTADDYSRYIRRAFADMGYELSPEKLKEYILDLEEESIGKAKHTAKALKLFIKEIVKSKNSMLARELYESFKIPKSKPSHKPFIPDIATVKQIFNNIKDIGAKAFFLLLTESGLRVGEVLSLKLEQVDFEHRIIHINKISETKRAYITFLHESTAKWIKEVYLPYREDFIRKYESSLRKLASANPEQGINVDEWKTKLFPFREANLRVEIKEAMKKVLGKEFRLYNMRAFFTSYMIKQKVPGTIVNLLQGRASPQQFKVMEENYFVISEIELREWYDKYAPRLL
ncbi:pNOB8-type archaeal integrase [Acidianus hospitalis W1]|uniref:PNOB8-type archaeal integrase n=1 Tax=Acidianus hospitalis (strain W1) TaxID=933801 RepID=F4B5L4_ACIHW|nr:site-specific integrase [Acidianus hospitalis]AEE94438.1 pNOB8-type archaeal integrase [Acidianus hospitalis W1]